MNEIASYSPVSSDYVEIYGPEPAAAKGAAPAELSPKEEAAAKAKAPIEEDQPSKSAESVARATAKTAEKV